MNKIIKENLEEIKQILWPVTIALLVFSLAFVGWLHSDMYQGEKEFNRLQSHRILSETYYSFPPEERAEWMEKYDLTDEDINPVKIISDFIARQEANDN